MSEAMPERLRDLLGSFGRKLGLDAPIETGVIWSRWIDIVGPAVAQHARPTSLRQGVLRLCADSPAWAMEMSYLSEDIKRAANEIAGRPVVREVVVWTGRLQPRARHRAAPANTTRAGSRPPIESADESGDPRAALERARRAWDRRERSRGR